MAVCRDFELSRGKSSIIHLLRSLQMMRILSPVHSGGTGNGTCLPKVPNPIISVETTLTRVCEYLKSIKRRRCVQQILHSSCLLSDFFENFILLYPILLAYKLYTRRKSKLKSDKHST